MSNISDAYTALKTRMQAVFPDHRRLSNPYEPAQNNERDLIKGWGMRLEGGSNPQLTQSCLMSVSRSITVILTRKFYSLELIRGGKEDAELELLEDHFLLLQDVEGDPTLNESDAVSQFDYISDGGIEFVFGDKDNFLKIESTFNLIYFENLN